MTLPETRSVHFSNGFRSYPKEKVMTDQISLSPELAAEAQMNVLRFGLVTTQAIAVAASFGLADLVATAPKTADELAQATGTHAPSLVRLLRFLTSLGIL
jgi:hypothetical protein